MLAATHLKKFKRILLAARQDVALPVVSTAFQWSSKVVPHPAGGQVLVSLSSAQHIHVDWTGFPAGCGFFVSAARPVFASNSAMGSRTGTDCA